MQEVARIVLALETPDVAEEVMHFLDRTGRARVVGTAVDASQLAEAVRQLEPDAVVATPSLAPARGSLNGTALLALDTAQSVSNLRRAIRAGAAGFYLWPAERDELAVAAARVSKPDDQTANAPATIVAVYGSRGGVGATFVATHLAATFAKRKQRCLLVDLDVAFADVTAALGIAPEEPVRTIADLAPLAEELGTRHAEEVLWRHATGFDALLAPRDERLSPRLSAQTYRAAIAALRRAYEVVVLHLPRALDEVSVAGLELSDRVLVVLGLNVLSFRDGKRAIHLSGVEDKCSFVVNRAGRAEITPRDVDRVFGGTALAVIPADRRAAAAQDHGRLLPIRGRAGRAFERLAKQLQEVSA